MPLNVDNIPLDNFDHFFLAVSEAIKPAFLTPWIDEFSNALDTLSKELQIIEHRNLPFIVFRLSEIESRFKNNAAQHHLEEILKGLALYLQQTNNARESVLMLAIQSCRQSVSAILDSIQDNPELIDTVLSHINGHGMNALMYGARYDRQSVIAIFNAARNAPALIDKMLRQTHIGNNWNALMYAAARHSKATATILNAAQSNPVLMTAILSQTDTNEGCNALMLFLKHRPSRKKIGELMIQHIMELLPSQRNRVLLTQNKQGETVLDMASRLKHPLLSLLSRAFSKIAIPSQSPSCSKDIPTISRASSSGMFAHEPISHTESICWQFSSSDSYAEATLHHQQLLCDLRNLLVHPEVTVISSYNNFYKIRVPESLFSIAGISTGKIATQKPEEEEAEPEEFNLSAT